MWLPLPRIAGPRNGTLSRTSVMTGALTRQRTRTPSEGPPVVQPTWLRSRKMVPIESGQPKRQAPVGAAVWMRNGWRGRAALLAAGAIAACSPGAVPVSQSPNDPSNPNAPEGRPAPSAAPVPTGTPSGGHGAGHERHAPSEAPSGHEGHSGHMGHGTMSDAGTGK